MASGDVPGQPLTPTHRSEFLGPAWRRLVDTFHMPGVAAFSGAATPGKDRGEPAYHWGFGALLAASGAIVPVPGGPRMLAEDLDLLMEAAQGYRRWGRLGYSSTARAGRQFPGEAYYDDNAWVGLAAWNLTPVDPRWRRMAIDCYRFTLRGQDRQSGGVFWKEQPRASLHVCSTGPALLLGSQLRQDGEFRVARGPLAAMWGWLRHMRSPDGRFWDHQRVADGVIDRTLYTYNSGTPLHALTVLGGQEDFPTFEDDLQITFEGIRHFETPDGGLPETPWFNAVLLRGLVAVVNSRGWASPLLAAYRRVVDGAIGRFEHSDGPLALYQKAEPLRLLEAAAAVETLALVVQLDTLRAPSAP